MWTRGKEIKLLKHPALVPRGYGLPLPFNDNSLSDNASGGTPGTWQIITSDDKLWFEFNKFENVFLSLLFSVRESQHLWYRMLAALHCCMLANRGSVVEHIGTKPQHVNMVYSLQVLENFYKLASERVALSCSALRAARQSLRFLGSETRNN